VPPEVAPYFALVDRYGLALVGFVLFVLAIYKRWLVTGSDHKAKVALLEKEITFRELLRIEERDAKMEAERRLDKALEISEAATDLAHRYEQLVREKIK
jgi:hypothetical protein